MDRGCGGAEMASWGQSNVNWASNMGQDLKRETLRTKERQHICQKEKRGKIEQKPPSEKGADKKENNKTCQDHL